jgi:hypothetical protein
VGIDGGSATRLADGAENSMIDFPHDDWVYFTMGSYHDHDSRIVKRVAVNGSGVEPVGEFDWRIAQIQVSNDLSRAVMRTGDSDGDETGTILAYDLTSDSYHDVGGGSAWSCGSGFFADGQHLMDGHQDPHEEMDIRAWDGSLVKTFHNSDAVSWPPNNGAAEPTSWNHSIFHTGASTNSPDWLCEAMGGSRDYASDEQVLINWRDQRCIVTTGDLSGPTDHGDFWVGDISSTSPSGQVSVEDNVDDQGQSCFKITTPSATYYYQKEGMGFSSIVDADGNDWISYQPGGGASGEYRGIPNMGWEFHPGYANGGSSWIVSQSDTRAVVGSKSQDGAWECQWAFYPTHAQMTLVKHSGSYWFLYEGTPGGGPSIDTDSDWWMLSDGTKKTCDNPQDDDIAGPEWICFGDAALERVLLLCHHEDDNHPDKFYQMDNQMTVFGFGRSGMTTYMDYAPAHFSIALYDHTDHATIANFAEGLMAAGESPVMATVPAQVQFTTGVGENPPPQTVTITNAGAGTLDDVSTSISYDAGENWLSVSAGGEGNQQTLANEVNAAGLAAGDYAATVTVTASNATPSSKTYAVALRVAEPAIFTAIAVTPSAATISAGGTVQFAAEARDQYDRALDPQPAISWSASDGWTISDSGLFTAGDTEGGPYTVTAEATVDGVSKSASATVTVQDAWREDFADGDAEGWTVGEGTWAVNDGAYGNTATGSRGSYSAWTGSDDWTDIDFSIDVTPASDSKDIWVIFRVRDAFNFYLYQLSGGDLYKQQDGNFEKIKDGDAPGYQTAQTYRIRVVLEGSSITVYSDGNEVLSHQDETFAAGPAGAGGYNSSVTIDNIAIAHQSVATALKPPRINAAAKRLQCTLNGERLRVHASAASIATATLLDSRGRVLMRRAGGADAAAVFDTRGLTQGRYIVRARLHGSERILMRSLMIVR